LGTTTFDEPARPIWLGLKMTQSSSAEIGPTAYLVLEVVSPPLTGPGRWGSSTFDGMSRKPWSVPMTTRL